MSVRLAAPPAETERGWFEEAVRRHYRLVFAIAYQVLGSARDAEDAAQDAFLRAYRGRDALEARESIEPWLARIARSAAIDLGRRKTREAALERGAAARVAEAGGNGTKPPESPGAAEAADERERLRRAIGALAEPEALVVTLRFVEGLTATEIASRLNEDPGTVRVRLHRALKRLRGQLKEE